MLEIVIVWMVLSNVIADQRPAGYLFYTASVINLDSNETSYMVGCSLNHTDISGNVSSRHLVITNLKGAPYETEVINDTSITHIVNFQVSDESTICGSREYVCRLNRTLIGMKTISVARPPPAIKSSDFRCISHNRKYLTCEFRRQDSCRFTTNYKLSMNRLGLISSCELTEDGSTLSFDSRSETCIFSAGHKNISFLIGGANIVGATEATIVVDHYDIVKPSAPKNLRVSFVNSTSVQVTWDPNMMLINLDRDIEFEFLMTSKYDSESSFRNMTSSKDACIVHEFDDLYAFTSYELKMRSRVVPKSVRNFEDKYWSDWSSVQVVTKPCRPYQAPRMAPGAYSFKERREGLTSVDIYWEPTPEYLHNGPGFDYDVFAISQSGHRYNSSDPVHPSGVATFRSMKADEQYTIHLSSYNNEGRSEDVSRIDIYPPEDAYDPKIKGVLFNDSYHLQWFPVDDPEHLSSYTIMHCTFSATGSCRSSIRITTLPPNASVYSIHSSKPLNFALAANYRFYSSELSWMQCIVPTPHNISRMTVKLTDVTEHSATLRLFLSCTDQSLVERYEVRYWPKLEKHLERTMTKRPYETVFKIDDLIVDTDYVVNVTVYDEEGIPHRYSHSVRTRDRDILLQLIIILLFGILVMAVMTTTVTRRVKQMMNIKVDIPIGLLGIDEMPVNFSQSDDQYNAYEEINANVLFSELSEKDEFAMDNPFDPDDQVQSSKVKSILKKPDEAIHDNHAYLPEHLEKEKSHTVIGNEYVQPSKMLPVRDLLKQDLSVSRDRSSNSSGYVDVNVILKQQMIR